MRKKTITLSFDLEQVCNDILAKCNLISKTIRDAGLEDIRANVQEPDDPETSSIINRAVTEAFGRVKAAAQRYLTVGRTADDNKLERLVSEVYASSVPAKNASGYYLYNYKEGGTGTGVTVYKVGNDYFYESNNQEVEVEEGDTLTRIYTEGTVEALHYETVTLTLSIPNFNVSVTDHLKSSIHKYIVDYAMGRFLQDQVADKAREYKEEAENEDLPNIISDLNARERYTMRQPNFM